MHVHGLIAIKQFKMALPSGYDPLSSVRQTDILASELWEQLVDHHGNDPCSRG